MFAEELIHKSFSAYGCIQEIRVFKEKGYAFIRSVSPASYSKIHDLRTSYGGGRHLFLAVSVYLSVSLHKISKTIDPELMQLGRNECHGER